MGTLPSPSLTDPDVRNSRIRFFTREIRSRWRIRWRSWLEAEDGVSGLRLGAPSGRRFGDLAETTTSAISAPLDGRTIAIVECCRQRRSRRSGPASLMTGGDAGRGWTSRRFRHQSLTAASARAKRLLAVTCLTMFLPFRDRPQTWVRPRKSKLVPSVSGWRAPSVICGRKSTRVGLQVRLIILRRDAVDAGSAVLAGQPKGLPHPIQIDDVVERAQRRPRFRLRQIGYPLSVRGQVCRVQSPLPCFRSTVLYSWRLPSLRRVPASPVPRFHRLYEGATTSRPRIPAPLWLRLRAPRAPPLFVLAEALLTDVEDVRQAWNS